MATTVLDTFVTIFEYKTTGSDKVEKIGKKLNSMGKSMTRNVTAPVVAAFTGMIFSASKFEDGLDNVLNLLDSDQVDKYSGSLGNMQEEAVKAGFSLDDSNRALFDNVSALGMSEKALDNYAISQKLAIGGNADLGVAIDGQTSVLNAYGKEVTDATEVANAFFTAQKAGKTTVSELAANVGKIAPVAKQAGIGYQTLLASMSQLTLGGLSTEEATTALRSAISGMIAPSSEAADMLDEFGLPVGAAALQAADFTEVLQKLVAAAKENPDAMAEMFPNIRALTAVSSFGADEVENLRNTVNQMGEDFKNGTGLMEAYTRRSGNAANTTKQMWGQLLVASKVLGEKLLPLFTRGVQKVTQLFEWFENLSDSNQKWILTLMAVAAAVGPVLMGVGKLIMLFNTIKNIIMGVKLAMAALNITMAANPIGLIIAAVTGLVLWFLKAKEATGSWQGALKLMGAQLIGFGQRMLKFVLAPTNLMISAIIKLLNIASKIPKVGDKFKAMAESVKALQDQTNLTLTGSSSANPLAAREQDIPFSSFLTPDAPAAPAALSTTGKTLQDNRQFNITAPMEINEATDGALIAEQFAAEIGIATENAAQDFQTVEAG